MSYLTGSTSPIIISIICSIILGQNVVLMEYETKCPTECGSVLKNGTDRIILRSKVDFTNVSPTLLKTVLLETRKSSDVFSTVCLIRTSSGCVKDTNMDCYCEKIDTDGIYHMVYNITALVKYSEADVRVSYTSSQSSTVVSNVLKLPEISEDVAPVITSSSHATLQIATTTPVPVIVFDHITSKKLDSIKDLLTTLIVLVSFILVFLGVKIFLQIRSKTRYTR